MYAFGMCVVEAMRVVEAKLLNKTKAECPPYPWGVLDIKVVKHHVLKGELPMRPSKEVCSDDQWALVERMCRRDPEKRIKITTVVDELAQLVSGGHDEGAETSVALDTDEHVSIVIAEMMAAVDDSEEYAGDDHALLRGVYRLLLKRLDHVTGQVTSESPACGRLKLLVERVRDGMAEAETCADSLTQFTETALRAYALHRQLDKFMAANFLVAGREIGGDEVHDWKSRCEALMGVEPNAIRSTGAATLPAAA